MSTAHFTGHKFLNQTPTPSISYSTMIVTVLPESEKLNYLGLVVHVVFHRVLKYTVPL